MPTLSTLIAAALLALTQDILSSEKGDLTIVPLQHATFVLKGGGKTVFVDPTGGGEAFKGQGKPDLILVTDIHGDHFDPKTLSAVRAPEAMLVVPAAVAEKLGADKGAAKILANGEKTACGDIGIEAVPMYNLTADRKNFHPKGRGNGYVLTIAGKRIYVSGDTEDIPEMRALKDIDAAFVCMNLPYTMDVEHAADAVLAFRPKVVYPYHYRGKEMSDVEKFKSLVAKDKGIEVRLLKWYP
ncbi:MAG TPA: MBL fold metallo-hydrolase [Planctomycetota bacterium]|jgi:L-ascorbate metabolism protein UlaG (beta-lactamase superfamily)|nr:MBL fold metallo-hydrolase [Planctomycetota bacterium]